MLPLLLLLVGCDPDEPKPDDSAVPYAPPGWDTEAEAISCPWGQVEAPLLDAALADADLTLGELGYSEDDWANASYAAYLDDPFLLSWFYSYQWQPGSFPCLGGQLGVDLDHAGASAHPVATALGGAMALVDNPTVGEPIDPMQAASSLADLSALPGDLATALVPVLQAMEEVAAARQVMAAAFSALGESTELEWLVDYGHGGVIIDYYSDPDMASGAVQDWVLAADGPRALHEPARRLAFAIEEAQLERFAGVEATLDQDTSLGRFVVAGPGADSPGELGEVAFYLDLGGSDVYQHPVAASSIDVPVSVHIDLGGDDSYGYAAVDEGSDALLPADEHGRYGGDSYYGAFSLSTTGRQGSGRLGVGLLFDLGAGSDSYQSLRVSQGWGHLGVGVLYDDGGDDIYLGEEGMQGAASMGIGLFMDQDGDDTHRSFANSQGFAYVQAAGLAWDGGGDDSWFVNPGKEEDGGTTVYYSPQLPGDGNSSFSQGAGFGRRGDSDGAFLSGGVGALRDRAGDDAYSAGTFAQGSGYWQGVGLLLDGEGHDSYDAYYYVQGGAAHYAAGVLLDDGEGDDAFNTLLSHNYMQVGAGHDFSVGVLVNEAGDDSYVYSGLAGGASNCQGIGLFVDNDGADTYLVGSDYSTGLGNHSGECEDWPRTNVASIGLFMDSGGDGDSWDWPGGEHPEPADDSSFGHQEHSTDDEHGGAVDGDGETALHAGGEVPDV